MARPRLLIVAVSMAASACSRGGVQEAGGSPTPPVTNDAAPDTTSVAQGDSAGGDATDVVEQGSRDPFSDPSLWSRVEIGGPCELYEADIDHSTFRRREWSSCGPGCLVALAPVWGADAELSTASAATVGADIWVRLLSQSPLGVVTHVSRLSDGATLAAVEERHKDLSCILVGGASSAPGLLPYFIKPASYAVGWLELTAPSRVIWPIARTPEPAGPTSLFQWKTGWGMTFEDGTLRTVNFGDPTKMIRVDSAALPSFSSAGRNDLVVWTSWETGTGLVVKGYSESRGPQTLARVAQGDANVVAISDRNIVWIGVHGPKIGEGTYDSAEFYWSPTAKSPDAIVVTRGPSLPRAAGVLPLQTGGDLAATIGCGSLPDGGSACNVFVARLSDGHLWKINQRPGKIFNSVLAVSPDEILLSEVDTNTRQATNSIVRLVRLGAARLDELQSAW